MRLCANSRNRMRNSVKGSRMLWYRCVARGNTTTAQACRSFTRYAPNRYPTTARRGEGFTSFFATRLATSLDPGSIRRPISSVGHSLFLQLLQLANLIHLQSGMLLLPAIERLLADSYSADQFHHRHPRLGLLYDGHDLLYGKPLPFHSANSSLLGFCRKLTVDRSEMLPYRQPDLRLSHPAHDGGYLRAGHS